VPRCAARSSRGLGRRPLKAEISGSNPLRATNEPLVLVRYDDRAARQASSTSPPDTLVILEFEKIATVELQTREDRDTNAPSGQSLADQIGLVTERAYHEGCDKTEEVTHGTGADDLDDLGNE
jgi:hypothetical protein